MLKYLDENDFFSTIMMSRGLGKLVLVVEGHDDRLVLEPHVSEKLILLAGAGGKQNVLKAAKFAHDKGFSNVRFLVDRDYDDYAVDPVLSLENVIYTSTHDMFIDIATGNPSLLLRIIEVKTDSARRSNGGSSVPSSNDILVSAFSLATSLAAVRIVNERRKLSLNFKDFPFGKIEPGETNVQIIAEIVISRSNPKDRNIEDKVILSESETIRGEIDEKRALVGDHDFFDALAGVLRSFGIKEKGKKLQESFIIKIDCQSLVNLEWFRKLTEWGNSFGIMIFDCKNDYLQ